MQPVFAPLGSIANKEGRVAGTAIAGGSETFAGTTGTSAVKVFDWNVARAGMALAITAVAAAAFWLVTVNGASPPTPAMPPWQPAQLKPPSAVGANSSPPQLANRLFQPSSAPA